MTDRAEPRWVAERSALALHDRQLDTRNNRGFDDVIGLGAT